MQDKADNASCHWVKWVNNLDGLRIGHMVRTADQRAC